MKTLLVVLRGLAAVVLGEATMVVLITLVQESLFGGVSITKSSGGVLLVSGALTFLILSGKTFDPVWFDILAAGSLVVGLLLGAYVHVVFRTRSGARLGILPRTT